MFITKLFSSLTCSKKSVLLENPDEIYKVKLSERKEISPDTRSLRFVLPNENQYLGLPIGQHVRLIADIDGKEVARKYTPVSLDSEKGYVDFVIKVYFKNVHPKFPEGGKMTQHIESLKIGDEIKIQGPFGKLRYFGNGKFEIKAKKDETETKIVDKVSMVAGGSGIAPMLQIIRDILGRVGSDKTQIALIFANQTEKDILLRDELDQLVEKYPQQLKVWYTLDRPDEGWKFGSGFVNKDMIKEHLFGSDEKSLFLFCGPPPMIKFVNTQLDELEYSKENRFNF